ncbi:MAG TPA: carboxylating nicotinate-nucleotide diphosphorylase [Firmicutes bacterium]|jgi:nicotinate-nucleotide pyrophosphorylase (carboxylating)|nr:carboxylating nicotinate-nucleotide diphosphorylase [Bacillota bacterium]
MNRLILENIVRQALLEDLQQGDITSEAIFDQNFPAKAVFLAKANGVLAGSPVVDEIFRQLDKEITCLAALADGAELKPGTEIAIWQGPIKSLLAGERTALNFLQRLSGIATQTAELVKLTREFGLKIVDTRKTTPGLRMLEKYAVRMGGGFNHRYNLADAVLIKDNHIAACGSITAAVEKARRYIPHTMTIEVETENQAQVLEALAIRADIIMLDNMSVNEMTEMVQLIRRRAIVEASGNIDERTIKEIAATGVDIISVGSLTHSVKALDISLEIKKV